MTITATPLYRALAKGVRKEDHAELARQLERVPADAMWRGFTTTRLDKAFFWSQTPQGFDYWHALSDALQEAGYECC